MSQQPPVQIKIEGGIPVVQNRQSVVQVISRPSGPVQAAQRFASPVSIRTVQASPAPSVQYAQNVDDMSMMDDRKLKLDSFSDYPNQAIPQQAQVQVQYGYPTGGNVSFPLAGTFLGPPAFGGTNTGRKQCNCTKSNCLKLYCECFAQGQLCQNCNCTNCMNNLAHEEERRRAVKMTLERNPTAFNPKIGRGEGERKHTKGCNCKRSGCLKNYCECYEAKISCSSLCRCCGCQNTEDSIERRSLLRLSALGSLKNRHNNSYKKNLAHPPQETLPHSFFTWETIEAMVGCMLAQAEEAEQRDLAPAEQERIILEEFGSSIERVMKAASKAQVRPNLIHPDAGSGLPLEDERHMHHERGGRGQDMHHAGHLIRQASDDEGAYMDDVQQEVEGIDAQEGAEEYLDAEPESLAETTVRAHRSRPPFRNRDSDEPREANTPSSGRKPRSGSRGISSMMDNLHMAPPSGSSRSGRRHVPSKRFQTEEEY
ncbi:lin-54 [Cichlidogyrus casuarinus]|uniref:Lin-54 n=1 Tax=Cichlidogyrus casuarinus TaxID=1844966 RepID=A0ABD2Q982_9PLAT